MKKDTDLTPAPLHQSNRVQSQATGIPSALTTIAMSIVFKGIRTPAPAPSHPQHAPRLTPPTLSRGSIQPAPARWRRKASIQTPTGVLSSRHRPGGSVKHRYRPRQGLYPAGTGPVGGSGIDTELDRGSIRPAPAR